MTVTCPECGKEFPEENAQYNGHRGYHKAHPESVKKLPKGEPSKPSTSRAAESISTTTTAPMTPTTGSTLQPITFTFSEGEKLPSQQEIPEFKSPEQEKKEAQEGKPETVKATLAEERKAGVSAIAALILPLMEMWNRTIEGGSAFPSDPSTMKLTKDDAEMVAQAVILVDGKYGGPLSKTLGSEEYGAEIFLLGVSIGVGIKMFMGLRLMQSKRKAARPQSAAPSPEEIPRSPLQKAADNLRNLVAPKKEEKKEPEKPEGTLSPEEFMRTAEQYQKNAITP